MVEAGPRPPAFLDSLLDHICKRCTGLVCCFPRYYETGSKSGIQTKHAARLRLQLAALDTARVIDDMDVPGYRLHPLKGRAKNRWSISVSGDWRLTFEFRDGNAYVLDYEDYHR